MLKKDLKPTVRFEAVSLESIYEVLDGISWLDNPNLKEIAQFSGLDPRTVGKVLKNCLQVGVIIEISKDFYKMTVPYPFKGSKDQKKEVIREAVFKMPLIVSYRQFLKLQNKPDDALRKAATVQKITNYEKKALEPIIKWAVQLNALSLEMDPEYFAIEGIKLKEERHKVTGAKNVVFLSHSSIDKPFIRQLAADLTSEGILVWLDEQQIKVGDSINEKVSQGLAESDFFVIALSENSIKSEWVKKELNSALIDEIESKKVKVFPIKIDNTSIPVLIKDKKYADFTKSYKTGLNELLNAINHGA